MILQADSFIYSVYVDVRYCWMGSTERKCPIGQITGFGWRELYTLSTILLPRTKTSIFVLRKQSSASAGRQTTGSFSLNDVLSTIGTPVSSRNDSIRRQ